MTRRKAAGIKMADSIIELCHMMYNHQTSKAVILSCVNQLQKRLVEFKPKKASEKVMNSRYKK